MSVSAEVFSLAVTALGLLASLAGAAFVAGAKLTRLQARVAELARARARWDDASERLARAEVKVDTLWEFQLRRGQVEAVEKGIARMNSPLEFSAESKSWFAFLSRRLWDLYRGDGRGLSDADLAAEIERRFGEEITREVCLPRNLSAGVCLNLALEVAKEAPP